MNEHQSKLGPGRIQFHQWCQPPIEPDDYTVRVKQKVKELGAEGEYDNEFEFSVAGPRFSLSPSEVYSVYPPKGAIGDFANTLPHVVFTRRTLPWERSITTVRDDDDRRPWMALLVFAASDFESEMIPDIVPRKVGELINAKSGDEWIGPEFIEPHGLQAYESVDDLCTTVDIPWKLFQEAAPSFVDLSYLAHVREVNTDNKETASMLADGWFSVTLANRFPEPELPLSSANLGDFAGLVARLTRARTKPDPITDDLLNRFSKNLQIETMDKNALLNELNHIIRGPSIYNKERFSDVDLSDETSKLLKKEALGGSEVTQLNKLLLEHAYPGLIVKSPPLAVENRVFLVSLEGLKDYLPGGSAAANKEEKPVRLAVLSSWTFLCREAFTFKSSMDKLNVARMGIPWKERSKAGSSDAEQLVRETYERGYSALNHNTRLGEKAVSWYRGPLVPFYLTKQTNYKFRHAADEALRYDPLTGMMDVTYAGAFQLGRLLGLQDRHFATSLYAYRTRVQRRVNQAQSKKRLHRLVGTSYDKTIDDRECDMMNTYLKTVGESRGSTLTSGWSSAATQELNDFVAKSHIDDIDPSVPKSVCQWLGRLMLLYRVPFTYLVPDERMLPGDSIRFFYLDPGWLKCLLEGACSVGRGSSRDELVDKELRDHFLEYAIEESQKVRTRSSETDGTDGLPLKVLGKTGASWPYLTGFLLRSPVVEGWQGLEMRAWETWEDDWTDDPEYWENKSEEQRQNANEEKERNALKPLRIDRLGSDIMICIFDGKVNTIEIKQPPEGMHFGATQDAINGAKGNSKITDVEGNGYTRLSLRQLSENHAKYRPGDQIDNSKTSVPLRPESRRVVDMVALVTELQNKLDLKDGTFTSAEFGVEMVESPGRVVFDVKFHEKPEGESK